MEKTTYIDRTLISLRRKYSKDELVASLNRLISEKGIKVGQLEDELSEHKQEHAQLKLQYADALRIISERNEELKNLRKQKEVDPEVARLRKEVGELTKKNAELLKKVRNTCH